MRNLIRSVVIGAFGIAFGSVAQAQAPAPNSPQLVSCAGLSGDGLALCNMLTGMDVTNNWPSGVHVNFLSGVQDRPTNSVQISTETHCSSFASAVAYRQGTYLLRPPRHQQDLMANDQFTWMWNQSVSNKTAAPANVATAPRAGWTILGNSKSASAMTTAQTYANNGYLVFAAFRNEFTNPTCQTSYYNFLAKAKTLNETLDYQLTSQLANQICPGASDYGTAPGHIAVIRPNTAYSTAATIAQFGPVQAQAGAINANGLVTADGFPGQFPAGQVYFFAYGGPAPAYQGFAAGLYAASSQRQSQVLAVERTTAGNLLTGLISYDKGGSPTWFYGETGLAAANGWLSAPDAEPAPTTTFNDPMLYKPFYQPATSGQNWWDPDGDPMPFAQVGSVNISFSPGDNTQMTASLAVSDSGQLQGPTGFITTDPGYATTLSKQSLSRIVVGTSPVVTPAPAAAPSAGWWWANPSLTGWNTAASFMPLAAFLDVQGNQVSALLLGATPLANPAGAGSPVAPYRPSWIGFTGSVQSNGQIDGSYYSCQQPGGTGAAVCTPGIAGSWALSTDQTTITLALNGTTYSFNRFRSAVGNPVTQVVPITQRLTGSNVLSGYLGNITVGANQNLPVTLDTGSSALYLAQTALTDLTGITVTGTPLQVQTYADGTGYASTLAYGYLSIGGVTTPTPIAFGLITTCYATYPTQIVACNAPNSFMSGRVGVMGVTQEASYSAASGGSQIFAPLRQLPAPFNTGFIASLSGQALTLGLTPTSRARFTTVQMTAPPDGLVYGGPAAIYNAYNFDRHVVGACLTFSNPATGKSLPAQCYPVAFDTGAYNGAVSIYSGVDTSAWVSSGWFNPGLQVTVALTNTTYSSTVYTSTLSTGATAWLGAYTPSTTSTPSPSTKLDSPHSNLGAPFLQANDFLYDGVNGLLGLAPAANPTAVQ